MVENSVGKEVFIPERYQRRRAVFEKIITSIPIFRSEIVNPEKLESAKEILSEMGLVLVLNHFSRKETAQVFQIPFRDKEFRKRKILASVAKHQKLFFMDPLSRLLGVDLRYIVTEETVRRAERKGRSIPNKNEGAVKFMDDALETLSGGGIMILFPQATRRETLYSPDNPRTIGVFMARAKRNGVRMGFMFVGVDLDGDVDDYSKVDGYNWRKKYKLTIGNSITDEDLLAQAGDRLGEVDKVAYKELEGLVSPKYANLKDTFK